MSNYTKPDISFLEQSDRPQSDVLQKEAERAARLEEVLCSQQISAQVVKIESNGVLTRFALELGKGVKVADVEAQKERFLAALECRKIWIEASITGTQWLGIVVPCQEESYLRLRDALESEAMRANESPTLVPLGIDVSGTLQTFKLESVSSFLITGMMGNGKSAWLHSILATLLCRATPQQVRFVLIDPYELEYKAYKGVPHLLTDIASGVDASVDALIAVVDEMKDRYRRFQEEAVRGIGSYNSQVSAEKQMPQIVVAVDHLDPLLKAHPEQVEEAIQLLSVPGRWAGIHLFAVVQRLIPDAVPRTIMDVLQNRIACRAFNAKCSVAAINVEGAETLYCPGDMLCYIAGDFEPRRVQGCYGSEKDIQTIVADIREKNGD